MDRIELVAGKRNILGKKVRFLRREGIVPANMYGHERNSTSLQIEGRHLKQVLAKAGTTTLVSVRIDSLKESRLAMIRDVQRDPRTGNVIHVDLYHVSMQDRIKLPIPITLVGEPPAVRAYGGVLVRGLDSLDIECLASDIPQGIEVDLSGLKELDDELLVKDLAVPPGATVLVDPKQLVVKVARQRLEKAEEVPAAAAPEAAEAKEEAAPAKGEAGKEAAA